MGEKLIFSENSIVCDICDSEYNLLDIETCIIPHPAFTVLKLNTGYAIIDTNKQKVYVRVNEIDKAQLISDLLNKHTMQVSLDKILNKEYL